MNLGPRSHRPNQIIRRHKRMIKMGSPVETEQDYRNHFRASSASLGELTRVIYLGCIGAIWALGLMPGGNPIGDFTVKAILTAMVVAMVFDYLHYMVAFFYHRSVLREFKDMREKGCFRGDFQEFGSGWQKASKALLFLKVLITAIGSIATGTVLAGVLF